MWGKRRRPDEDFHQEIEAHLDLEADRLASDGMDPADARRAARKRFGNVASAKERYYEAHRLMWLDRLRQDVRYACRGLARRPGFTATAT